MKAYNVKIGTKVKVVNDNVVIPPASILVSKGDIVVIEGLDGMYCYCINDAGDKVYIAAWTEIEVCT